MEDVSAEWAAWVQAIGTIAAVLGAAWVAAGEARASRRREEQSRREMVEREKRSLLASRRAALNLALLAARQIHDLHTLLRDETRRSRVARVSPSRTLITTERLLLAFPIQSLSDADAMVAFSYFPGSLAMAAEIYSNLEAAVRAIDGAKQGEVFAEFAKQMAQLERAVNERLGELRTALGTETTAATAACAGQRPPESGDEGESRSKG